MTEIERIDTAIKLLREMKADATRMKKLSACNLMELTPKQAQKRNADADWLGMAKIKRGHQLHALFVELGFAERRPSYAPIELSDGWHRYTYTPPEPNAK